MRIVQIDLVVGAQGYSTDTGRVYIFSNDGSIPTTGRHRRCYYHWRSHKQLFQNVVLLLVTSISMGKPIWLWGPGGYSSSTGRAYHLLQ
jgi:methionine aminopeptidase